MSNIDNNLIAYQKRRALPIENHFTIQELIERPALFDFVECNAEKNNKFKMFLAGNDDSVALRFFWNNFYEKKL
jgi:hypothetical protein